MKHLLGLAAVLVTLFPAVAGADQGVFPGQRPLVRIRWSAVVTDFKPVPSQTEVIVLQDGTVTRLETYDGSAFILRQTAGSPQALSLLRSELARWNIPGLSQTCRLTFSLGGTYDRLVVAAPGKPVRLTWYNAAGTRTTDIVMAAEASPGRPVCAIGPINVTGSGLSYISTVERSAPFFSTGFLPRNATGERQITGRVHCNQQSAGIKARVRLHQGIPYSCLPEGCFPSHPPLLDETTSEADGRFTLTVPAGSEPDLWVLAEPLARCSYEFGPLDFGQVGVSAEPLNNVEVRINSVTN